MPMTTNGQRGTEFERLAKATLIAAGYVVLRSAASKTGIDLVAFWDRDTPPPGRDYDRAPLAVQCKRNGELLPGAWDALYRLGLRSGSIPVLARRERDGRRYVAAFYRLTGPRVPMSRTWAMERMEFPEVADEGT